MTALNRHGVKALRWSRFWRLVLYHEGHNGHEGHDGSARIARLASAINLRVFRSVVSVVVGLSRSDPPAQNSGPSSICHASKIGYTGNKIHLPCSGFDHWL